ncbi:MAG: lysophospholipid acyltransferase family protein [Chloroflexota bacterium]
MFAIKLLIGIGKVAAHTLAKIDIEGIERIPQEGGCVVVSNHIGRLDAMLAIVLAERDDVIMFVAEKYQKYAFWRWAVRQVDGIWLNRFDTDFHALREVHKRLKGGGILAIAPEGTRSRSGKLLPGKQGAAFLAAKAGVPIVPIALTGTEDTVVKSRLRRLQRLDVTIRVGEPFALPPLDRKDRDAYLEAQTTEIMCRIAALLPPDYHGHYAAHPRLLALREA